MRERRRWLWTLLIIPIGLALFWWAQSEREQAERDARAGAEAADGGQGGAAASEEEGEGGEPGAEGGADGGVLASTRAPVRLSPAQVTSDPSSEGGTLRGRVVGFASGAPVPGAELAFTRGDTTEAVRADDAGEFVFAPSEPGTYVLALATADGFLPFAPEWGQSPIRFEARAGVRVDGVTVTLVDAIDYTVRVVRGEDEPVPGATVRVFGLDRGERALAPMQDTYTTGDDGEVDIHAPDYAVVEASHPAHGRGRGAVDTGAQVAHLLTIRLTAELPEDQRADTAVVGRVVDEADQPVAGALVVATLGNTRSGDLHPSLEGLSGEDGRFRLDGADRGAHRVVVTADGYARERVDGVSPESPTDIVLSPEGVIRARVVDAETSESLAAWTVIVEQHRGALEWDTLASESGYGDAVIEVRGLPRGRCRVLGASPGYAPSEAVEAQASADPRPLEIRLARGGSIAGRVVSSDGGRPLEGARASVEGRIGAGTSAVPIASTALTDEDGRFELTGVRRGLVSVVVWASDHHGRVRSGIVVADDPIDIGTLDLSVVEEGEEPRIELAGIGAVLAAEGDVMMIRRVIDGGGAAEIGLAAGDAILEIEGASVGSLGFGGCIERIRGPEGTIVRLTVRRAQAEEPVILSVPRRRIRA